MEDFFDFSAKPTHFWLTLNRECNFRCKWCYGESSDYKANDNMSFEQASGIIDLAYQIGVDSVTLIGGEPTLWKPLLKLVSYCKKKNIKVGIVTNACIFSNDDYWKSYQENPCDSIGISIKGVTNKHFKEFVGRERLLEPTILGISRALCFYENAGVSTFMSSITSNEDILDIATVARKLGAKSFMISPSIVTLSDDNISCDYTMDPCVAAEKIINLYPQLNDLYGGEITIESSLPLCVWPAGFVELLLSRNQLTGPCHVHDRSGLVFDTNGGVLPCNSMLNFYIIENMNSFKDGQFLLDSINSQVIREIYENILRLPHDSCSKCRLKDRCRGGCILNWTSFDPDLICRPF